MNVLKWDFTKLSTVKYEANQYEINEKFINISVKTDTADLIFALSDDGKCRVECYEEGKAKHSVRVEEDALVIRIINEKSWYDHIGINFGSPKITVYLPNAEYTALSISGSTGNISVKDISAEAFELSTSTGRITVSNVSCKGDMNIQVTTGNTTLTDIECKNLTSGGSTGNISLNHVVVTEKLSIKRSTGDVRFDSSDAAEIFVETGTGDVKGSLLTDKVFTTHTGTGRVDVPKTVNGGRCEISTGTGDIKITVWKSYTGKAGSIGGK